MEIGEKIRNRRMELGWSQRDLADKMGYTNNSTIAKIEQGKTDVTQSRVIQFSKVLGVSIAYLMDWENGAKKLSPDKLTLTERELLLLDLFKQVPESKQDLVLDRIRDALKNR